ncbi:MAG TPA: pyruvate kinase [Gemmatimonadaceae bacterium]|nr:pyruvate kinase [Gemmatimonadaceae bacterium]
MTGTPPAGSVPTDRTKIVCTLGPASATPQVIASLLDAGMSVARINFSHGTHETHARAIALVRQLAAERKRPVAILGDLQGPRIRIGTLDAPITVAPGDEVILCDEDTCIRPDLPVTYTDIARDVKVGDRVLIDDGLIELVVLDIRSQRVVTRVLHGGAIGSHKGMNFPGVQVSAPSITEKDRADAAFAVEQKLDYLALSFVRRAEDLAALRELIPNDLLVIAKIEKDSALDNIEDITRAADGIMVARGDLGVELPFEEVPLVQKRLIRLANQLGRPVITATQMLESMVEHPRPTRAEASDVANAILDGTDAVMLSAETAVGAYPELAVRAMRRIIAEIEKRGVSTRREERKAGLVGASTEETIAVATRAAAVLLDAPLVVVFTKSGFSARIVASQRPDVPILGLTPVERTYHQLSLIWGVIPALGPPVDTYAKMFEYARTEILQRGLAKEGDRVLVTAGVPFDVPGTTNLVKVEVV